MKVCGSTVEMQLKLVFLSGLEAGGICRVAVKCIDMAKNPDCEGSSGPLLTLKLESAGIEQD
ncbi:hypothetical protein CIT14_21695 [Virgibacillus profundi]|nr:hypothetical protein CIT14_21695 [Virgibacillus profundi]